MSFPSFLKVAVFADVIVEGTNKTYHTDNRYYHMGVRLTKLLSQAIGFEYELFPSVDGEFGRLLPNGSWTGMIGMVHRGEVDMAISEMAITEARRKVVQYSYPFSCIDVTFVTQRPDRTFDLATVLEPFSFEIWIGILIYHIIMPFAIYALFHRRYSFQKIVLKTFGTFFGQQGFRSPIKISEKLIILSWMVGMMFMSNMYKAHLLSILTFPTLRGVRHITDLSSEVKKGNYECVTYAGSYYTDVFLTSPDESFQIIGHNLDKNRGSSDVEQVLLDYRKSAFVGPKPDFMHLKNKHFISSDIFFSELPAIAIRKDFCCRDKFEETIFWINAGGLYKKLLEDESFNLILGNFTEFAYPKDESVKTLSLDDLSSVFLCTGVGYTFAIIVFIAELIVGKLQKKKERVTFVKAGIRYTQNEYLISEIIRKLKAS